MFTQKQISQMPAKNVSIDQFIKMVDGIDQKWLIDRLRKLDNGEFLAIWRNKDKKWYRLHLKKIWIRRYQLPYRTIKTKDGKARIGREMLISSIPLPRGKIIN